ncbi:MAG: methyltransferase domain-containing protein [Betaproteobacteria bacterium]|nr:methyltransferase domain-containing protein [Betaproteobacteria bacterium]
MRTVECAEFLQEALPELGLRWAGFRKVRGLVRKRLGKRFAELGLADFSAYRVYLELHPSEWHKLEEMCRIPISRFYRDRAVFASLERDVLPALAAEAIAQGRHELRCWSACCASGEEPYTLSILWHLRLASAFPGLKLRIVATDIDPAMLRRARPGCYRASSIKDLPEDLMRAAFERSGEQYCVRTAFRTVDFVQQDIRESMPDGLFDLILCRNAVLTYFLLSEQQEVMKRVIARLEPGGALVIGLHETLPPSGAGLASWTGARAIYRAPPAAETAPPMRCIAPHPH